MINYQPSPLFPRLQKDRLRCSLDPCPQPREATEAMGKLHLPLPQAGVLQNSEMYFPALKT